MKLYVALYKKDYWEDNPITPFAVFYAETREEAFEIAAKELHATNIEVCNDLKSFASFTYTSSKNKEQYSLNEYTVDKNTVVFI